MLHDMQSLYNSACTPWLRIPSSANTSNIIVLTHCHCSKSLTCKFAWCTHWCAHGKDTLKFETTFYDASNPNITYHHTHHLSNACLPWNNSWISDDMYILQNATALLCISTSSCQQLLCSVTRCRPSFFPPLGMSTLSCSVPGDAPLVIPSL